MGTSLHQRTSPQARVLPMRMLVASKFVLLFLRDFIHLCGWFDCRDVEILYVHCMEAKVKEDPNKKVVLRVHSNGLVLVLGQIMVAITALEALFISTVLILVIVLRVGHVTVWREIFVIVVLVGQQRHFGTLLLQLLLADKVRLLVAPLFLLVGCVHRRQVLEQDGKQEYSCKLENIKKKNTKAHDGLSMWGKINSKCFCVSCAQYSYLDHADAQNQVSDLLQPLSESRL
jgi:hypothetical protein